MRLGAQPADEIKSQLSKIKFAFAICTIAGGWVFTSVVFCALLSRFSERADGIGHAYMPAVAP